MENVELGTFKTFRFDEFPSLDDFQNICLVFWYPSILIYGSSHIILAMNEYSRILNCYSRRLPFCSESVELA